MEELAKLPGGTTRPLGDFDLTPFDLGDGPVCEKGEIVVPENRQAKASRNIALQFYRIKSRGTPRRSPMFVLPGGPGGYFDDGRVAVFKSPPQRGPQKFLWEVLEDRDVIFVNQRGARAPDKRYRMFGFMHSGMSLNRPFSQDEVGESIAKSVKRALDQWGKQGMDVAGYDIMNMVEDLEAIRKALDYKTITLRGTSFGSQWAFAYMSCYPNQVDRALLSGIEPLDYGYDSHEGIWKVLLRLEKQFHESETSTEVDIKLTEALKAVVERLASSPVEVQAVHAKRDFNKKIPLGAEDFQRFLRAGINATRETRGALERLPKYIFEIYREDYSYLASRTLNERAGFGGGSLQALLIDNSLGISKLRDQRLTAEPARAWLGELNMAYKATRDLTPTPVIADTFRKTELSVPILMVHGDLDMSTPIENAEVALQLCKNAHLIRVAGGTHRAFDQIREADANFQRDVFKFLNADFTEVQKVKSLGLPSLKVLPELQFEPLKAPTLFEELKTRQSSGQR